MRAKLVNFLALCLGLLLAVAPLLGHHSFMAEFDVNKSITLDGVVTKVEWANPHISFYVDVKDDTGKVTNWGFDGAAPAMLTMRGWTRTSLKPGDHVTVAGFAARNGTPFAAASMVTLADGRRILAGSDGAYPR